MAKDELTGKWPTEKNCYSYFTTGKADTNVNWNGF